MLSCPACGAEHKDTGTLKKPHTGDVVFQSLARVRGQGRVRSVMELNVHGKKTQDTGKYEGASASTSYFVRALVYIYSVCFFFAGCLNVQSRTPSSG